MLQLSSLSEVFGYSNTGGPLHVSFSNVSVVTLYSIDLGYNWELQVGPALMINKEKIGISDWNSYESENTKLSPGLLSGLNYKIWDGKISYGKIGTQLLLTIPTKMGPYIPDTNHSDFNIPESKISFSHLKILFMVGIHI